MKIKPKKSLGQNFLVDENIINLMGIDDKFVEHGSRSELLELVNLSVEGVYTHIMEIYEK